jgi:hypothetical protein
VTDTFYEDHPPPNPPLGYYQTGVVPQDIALEYPTFTEQWKKTIGKAMGNKTLSKRSIQYWGERDLWTLEQACYLVHNQRPINRDADRAIWDHVRPLFDGPLWNKCIHSTPETFGKYFQYEIDDRMSELRELYDKAMDAIAVGKLKSYDKELAGRSPVKMGNVWRSYQDTQQESSLEVLGISKVSPKDFLNWFSSRFKYPQPDPLLTTIVATYEEGVDDINARMRSIMLEVLGPSPKPKGIFDASQLQDVNKQRELFERFDEADIKLKPYRRRRKSYKPKTFSVPEAYSTRMRLREVDTGSLAGLQIEDPKKPPPRIATCWLDLVTNPNCSDELDHALGILRRMNWPKTYE